MSINKVVTAIEDNWPHSVRALATELKISQKSIRQILTGEFGRGTPFLRMDKI